MRFFQDSCEHLCEVQWYWTDRTDFIQGNAFCSSRYDEIDGLDGCPVGEQTEVRRWRDGSVPPGTPQGPHPIGTPEQWAGDISLSDMTDTQCPLCAWQGAGCACAAGSGWFHRSQMSGLGCACGSGGSIRWEGRGCACVVSVPKAVEPGLVCACGLPSSLVSPGYPFSVCACGLPSSTQSGPPDQGVCGCAAVSSLVKTPQTILTACCDVSISSRVIVSILSGPMLGDYDADFDLPSQGWVSRGLCHGVLRVLWEIYCDPATKKWFFVFEQGTAGPYVGTSLICDPFTVTFLNVDLSACGWGTGITIRVHV